MEKKIFEYELESFHLEQNHNGTKHDLVVLVKDYSPHGQDQEFRLGIIYVNKQASWPTFAEGP